MTQQKPQQYFIDRHAGGEKAVLVCIDFNQGLFNDSVLEFKELALSAGVAILDLIIGKRDKPAAKYFVGVGKAQEIKEAVLVHDAEVVIVNHDLTPAQERNLEKLCQCRVLDRTELILDIFAQRARTFEGKLQVELAQLKHLSTRLVRGWTHLERQKGGIGLRGPGETQLETDRRLLGMRIKAINKRLEKVASQRYQGRRARQRADIPTVSLVGYTNAGKSTLFNTLTAAHVYSASQLFATLDPTLRHIQLPHFGKVIVADTVGFIRDLPHDLVAAFRATLEETQQADLLLHVVDAHQDNKREAIWQVNKVLEEIHANEIPVLQVYNKIDLLEHEEPYIECAAEGEPYRVWLSSLTGAGIDLLNKAMAQRLTKNIVEQVIVLSPDQGKLKAQLYAMGAVDQEQVDQEGNIHLSIKLPRQAWQQIKKSGNKS